MMRKRHREQDAPSKSSRGDNVAENDKHSANRIGISTSCIIDRIRQRPRCTVILAAVASLTIWGLIRGYYALELLIKDPFLEAKVITPLDYLRVRYLEAKPTGRPRRFDMNQSNTFVINLDSDTNRYANFQRVNKVENATELFYQRFSAFRWVSSPRPKSGHLRSKADNKETSNDEQQRIRIQQDAMRRYPYLRYSVDKGVPGNAGCSMSHIQLLEQLVQLADETTHDKYYFVFEDDARLSKQLLLYHYVEGTPDADIVILSPTSTKTVRIPYAESRDGFAVRVLQSFGAFAYIVTSEGANKLLKHFRGDHDDPIDVAFHQASGIKMYHPTNGWPQAYHSAVRSTRHSLNNG